MSESNTKQVSRLRSFGLWILLFVGTITLLGGGYMAGSFIMPNLIHTRYQTRNCQGVLSLDDSYKRMYPPLMIDQGVADQVRECAVYTLGVINAEKKSWLDSYHDFQVYSETYPQGLFVKEAREQGAAALAGLTKEKLTEKKFPEAIVNLNLILSDYGGTGSAVQAEALFPELYKTWGGELRDAGDYAGAEQTFNEYQTWAQNQHKADEVASARSELAQTYLAWSLNLQAQQQFEKAKSILELAIATDPKSGSDSGPAAQATASLPQLYIQWGNSMVEQGDFAGAFERYNTALADIGGGDPSTAKDAIANGYLKWANHLANGEDFLGALQKVDQAKENSASNAMQKTVEDGRTGIYLAFSKSSGKQAQQAIQDALKLICQQHAAPARPIFGLDKDRILAGIYGLDQKLPDEVAATTPGEMHYVVCVDEVISKTVQYVDFYGYQMFRIKESWSISLRDAATGKLVENHIVEGQDPPALPSDPYAIAQAGRVQRYFGRPDMNDLADWLMTVMK